MATQTDKTKAVSEAEARLVEAFQKGDYGAALTLARGHLASHPKAAFAHTIIGMSEVKLGNLKPAERAFRDYSKARPEDASGWKNLGQIQRARGDNDKAVASFRKASTLAKGDAAAWLGLGTSLHATGATKDALTALGRATKLAPSNPTILTALGEVILAAGDAKTAETVLTKAVQIAPKHGSAHLHLGLAFRQQRRLGEAESSLRQAVTLLPRQVQPTVELGRTLASLGRIDEAVTAFTAARSIDPGRADATKWLGRLRLHKGDANCAITAFTEALQADPSDADLHFQLGNLLFETRGYADALAHLKSHLSRDPTDGITSAAIALRAKKPDVAHAALKRRDLPREPSLAVTAWNVACISADFRKRKQFDGLLTQLKESPADGLGDILGLTSVRNLVATDADIAQYLELQKSWSAALSAIANAAPLDQGGVAHKPDEGRLRIGFMTMAGIRGLDRALLPLVEQLDRARFEVVWVVAGGTAADRASWSRFDEAADQVVRVTSRDDHSLAKVLAGLGLDILIDLNGIQQPGSHVGALAWKPAKLQMTWAGSPTECRLEALDYQILDAYLTAPEGSPFAVRDGCQPLVMPSAWMCVGTLPDLPMADGLPSDATGHVTFGNMLTPDKLTPELVAVWSEVLKSVPESRLILSRPEYATDLVRDNIRSAFAREGVKDGVEFRSVLEPGQSHLEGYRDYDIALDAYPVGGGVTVAEALWMGVPCVTRTGPLVQHRVGLSVLASVGAEDLAVETDADYVARAVALAQDTVRRRTFRENVRTAMGKAALFRHDIFVPEFADTMWKLAKDHGLRT